MRILHFSLIAAVCLNGGCITAARKVEQAIRRGMSDDEPNRPAARNLPSPDELPATAKADFDVRPGHPRLFVAGAWPKPQDATAVEWQAIMRRRFEGYAKQPPIEHSATKLLNRSRDALKRLSQFGAVYQFSRDPAAAEAGRKELLNVCAFPDWQPNDFLATAEMMTAASIGYDWLYDVLSPAERKTVSNAIVRLGLKPAFAAYASKGGWTRAQHNWNLVCNGGVIVASLAVLEEDPATARRTLALAMDSIRYGLSAYDKAGGTAEGPMYHSYATRYLAFAAAALKTAPTTPVALTRSPNWLHAGDYRLAMTGPTGKSADFGDSSGVLGNTAWMFFLAQETGNKAYAAFETRVDASEPSAFDLLWYQPTDPKLSTSLPGPKAFGSAAVLRPPGDDPLGPFVAVRTGSTADHHSHLDLGQFIFDVLGERFVHDLGPDNYDLPGYLTNRRPDYLRSSTRGHNTLTIGESSQPADALSTSDVSGTPDGVQSVRLDMTEAYPGLKSAVRTVRLDGRSLTVRDDLRSSRSTTVTWHLHTPAKVTLSGETAVLDIDGKRVELTVVSPEGAMLTMAADVTEPPEKPVEGSTHLRFKTKVEPSQTIEVRLQPITP